MKKLNQSQMMLLLGGANCPASPFDDSSPQQWVQDCFLSCRPDVVGAILNGSFLSNPVGSLTCH